MPLKIERRYLNHRVFWADSGYSLATRGYTVMRIAPDGSRAPYGYWPAPIWDRLLTASRPIRHGLRLGFHNLWPLPDGSMVGIVKKTLVKRPAGSEEFRAVGRLRWGNKPGLKGLCVDEVGLIYYGEYAQNMDRSLPIGLHRSDDGGNTYHLIHEFAAGKVRHIHFVQPDPYAGGLWMGTGDRDQECLLLHSTDRGQRWSLVGGGSQLWRAVGVIFTAEAIYWGTDAGSCAGATPNFIVRWDRRTRQLSQVQEIQGPSHGNARLQDGTLLVCTGVEGGVNEKDRSMHLWAGSEMGPWAEIAAWTKDPFPKILQFGVGHFPHGIENQQSFHMTLRAAVSAPEVYLRAALT